jgi:F-type H+-transporting ATPase subunit b
MLYLASSLQQPSDPLVPSLTELIVGAISFFIVFGALWKILLPRITKTLEARTDAIEGGLKRAEDARLEASGLLEQYRAQLAEARHDASRMREEAKVQGAQILAELRAQGAAEKQRLIDSASAQIAADRQQVLTALRAEVGTLAVELAGRVVGESLADDARQRRVVDRFLAELESQAGGAGVRAGR